MIEKEHEKYMKMCFELALLGKGQVSPNPMVGCVVLDKNGELVSKGYHKKYGENHAERDALLKLHNNEAEGGILYVNLEPCSHYGKTPPCTDLIIERKIKKVVIASYDINPKVDGLSKLREAGIEVIEGVLENEANFLNRVFIKNMRDNLPYVVLKTATTMDGKIATKSGDSKWITSDEARKEVYKMRSEFDCILTSSNTVIADNPSMEHKFKCILDKDDRTSKDAKIYKQGEIHVATKRNTPLKNGYLDLRAVLEELYKKGICSVFVECGGKLAGAFLRENLIDEIYQFIAPKIVNDNSAKSCFNGDSLEKIADCKNFKIYDTQIIGDDVLIKFVLPSLSGKPDIFPKER
ncbi:MAG: bifunctional diaminohydroxyphosphoribosylaminopyrimidine deaminase/5-amino-6-(5-phosphoribosylamino)uracil reductase RibD [Alphaproteobacteria bacterium]|nr:bifunctional diaminohydroxyphosphoribosylaminopyrimidine deaminase/5-amino-6-(5-phosphoribosylamino)uracil reductase RibD [Alphaproteobacteria bacterium]